MKSINALTRCVLSGEGISVFVYVFSNELMKAHYEKTGQENNESVKKDGQQDGAFVSEQTVQIQPEKYIIWLCIKICQQIY